jgi:hypothetical protein
MAQTHVLAAHLDNHGDLIADPDTPSEHLIATFPVDAYESLWEDKGWVLVNRAGEAVESLEEADPDAVVNTTAAVGDRGQLRKERAKKFTRAKAPASRRTTSQEA